VSIRAVIHAGFANRGGLKFAGLLVTGLAALYFGFVAVAVVRAEMLVRRGGYYFMLLTFALWLWALWRLHRDRTAAAPAAVPRRREMVAAVSVIALLTLVALVHESFGSKILFDEFALQSTAFNMHYFREAATMVRGYDIQGTFISTDNYLDKRPYFFPFLLSLVHDLTGYRPANAYWLNGALYPLVLSLVYTLGRRLAGWRSGLLAAVLLGTLPLFAQNASGSGMELLNLGMLLASVALAAHWLAVPDENRLSALVLAAVLLAQTRYESALYVAPTALAVLAGWGRARRLVLSWPAVLSPLLLLPVAFQNRVVASLPTMWELHDYNQTSRFSWDYLQPNLRGAWNFLFAANAQQANSLWLTTLSLAALAWLGWRLVTRTRSLPRLGALPLAVLLFGSTILVNTVLILFYYWASYDDPMSARFSLPLHLLMVFAAVVCAAEWDKRLPATPVLLGVTVVCALGSSLPKQAYHHYSNLGTGEISWELRYVHSLPSGQRLILTNKSTLPWLLEKTPSILLGRAVLVADRLADQLHDSNFTEILVFQSLRPSTVEGDHQLVPEEVLPPWFRLELLIEKRFGTKIVRVSRLVAVDLPPNFKPRLAPKKAGPADAGEQSRPAG
jgi:hypothetical protein